MFVVMARPAGGEWSCGANSSEARAVECRTRVESQRVVTGPPTERRTFRLYERRRHPKSNIVFRVVSASHRDVTPRRSSTVLRR